MPGGLAQGRRYRCILCFFWGKSDLSRLTDLIAQAKARDPALGQELEREFKVLSSRRSFGLNFERHRPESVELPGRPIRKGDKVRILPPRGSTAKGDQRLIPTAGTSPTPCRSCMGLPAMPRRMGSFTDGSKQCPRWRGDTGCWTLRGRM